MRMINKKDLARKISEKTLLSIKESSQVVEVLFDSITEELSSGKEVSIVNFGKFVLYKQKPRPVRNPKTMQEMILEEFFSVKFKPSTYIKDKVKNK
jgi:nucleoid DNA-binding protein